MTMIAMSFGTNGGFAINPARDLGPRLFTLCVGYGWEVFSAHYPSEYKGYSISSAVSGSNQLIAFRNSNNRA